MKVLSKIVLVAALFVTSASTANAITWFPEEFTCPIDNQKNTFLVVGSYGSYIYAYPSKYQWLFFPVTDSPTYYLCKKCHLSTYMWDYDKLPKEKLAAIKGVLKDIKGPAAFKEYTDVPVIDRLAIMEKVYSVLDKDEEWWENFYRIKGYHLAKSGKMTEAAEARRKSLELIKKFIKDEKSEAPKKLLFYISGAMNHFIGDDKAALADLETALRTAYANKDESAEDIKSAEEGLNERIKDYIALIKTPGKSPRESDHKDTGH